MIKDNLLMINLNNKTIHLSTAEYQNYNALCFLVIYTKFITQNYFKRIQSASYKILFLFCVMSFASTFKNMKIEHLAIWAKDIEKIKTFYLEFFELSANEKYFNPTKKFSSYFLSFASGARIELMNRP